MKKRSERFIYELSESEPAFAGWFEAIQQEIAKRKGKEAAESLFEAIDDNGDLVILQDCGGYNIVVATGVPETAYAECFYEDPTDDINLSDLF